MPISPSPTQVGLSVANAAELSTVSVTQSSAGEIAYKRDDKTYWSLDLSVTASGGYPTASGQGRWVPFPGGGGGGSVAPFPKVVYVSPGSVATGQTGSIGNPFGTMTQAISYIIANGGANPTQWTILVGPGSLTEEITIPPTFLDLAIQAIEPETVIWTGAPACILWTGAAPQNYNAFQFSGIIFVSAGANGILFNGVPLIGTGAQVPSVFLSDCFFSVTGAFNGFAAAVIGTGRLLRCGWFGTNVDFSTCESFIIDDCSKAGGVGSQFAPAAGFVGQSDSGKVSIVNGSIVQNVILTGATILNLDASSTIAGFIDTSALATFTVGPTTCAPQFAIQGSLGLASAPQTSTILTPANSGGFAGMPSRAATYNFAGCRLHGLLNFQIAGGATPNAIDMRGAWVDPFVANAISITGNYTPGYLIDLSNSSVNPGSGTGATFTLGQIAAPTLGAAVVVSSISGTSSPLPGAGPNEIAVPCPFLLGASKITATARDPGGVPGTVSIPSSGRVPGTGFTIQSSAVADTSTFDWVVSVDA